MRTAAMLTLACAICACHSLPPRQAPPPAPEGNGAQSAAPPPLLDAALPSVEEPLTQPPQIAPCLPVDNNSKPAPKRKPKTVAHVEPPPAAPAAEPPPKAVAEAGVKMVPAPESSILGRKVSGPEGDDLGRVVDVLADAQGRVRIAVIEFGGFLGVGNRRIAVDWSLLKFHAHDPDAPVVLDVARRMLQGTPEYKGSEHPLALMAPEVSASPRPNTPN